MAEKDRQSGATGNGGTLFVFNGTTLGGNGSIGAQTEVYGTIIPGMANAGTLTFADYTTSAGVNVTLHPEANIICRVKNAQVGMIIKIIV